MFRPPLILAACFAVAVLSTACDGGEPTPAGAEPSGSGAPSGAVTEEPAPDEPSRPDEPDEDRLAATRAMMQLAADERVDATRFEVVVRDGTARVEGEAANREEHRVAEAIVRAVPGIDDVQMQSAAPALGEGEVEADLGAIELADTAEVFAEAVAMGVPRDEPPSFEPPEGEEVDLDQAASGDRPRTYRVGAGDSLSVIALRTLNDGTQWRRIYELNRDIIGPNPERLVEGMELRIPQD